MLQRGKDWVSSAAQASALGFGCRSLPIGPPSPSLRTWSPAGGTVFILPSPLLFLKRRGPVGEWRGNEWLYS